MPMNVFALMFPIMKSYFERYVYKKINTNGNGLKNF